MIVKGLPFSDKVFLYCQVMSILAFIVFASRSMQLSGIVVPKLEPISDDTRRLLEGANIPVPTITPEEVQ